MRVFYKWSFQKGNPALFGIMASDAELFNEDTKIVEEVQLFSIGLLFFQIDFVW